MGTLTANTVQSEVLNLHGTQVVAIQQISSVAHQIRQITRDTELHLLARDKADLSTALSPGSWCVAECLEHLTQTTRAFIPAIADAIAEAAKLTSNRPLRTGILADLLIRTLHPPYRMRFNVLPQLVPHRP